MGVDSTDANNNTFVTDDATNNNHKRKRDENSFEHVNPNEKKTVCSSSSESDMTRMGPSSSETEEPLNPVEYTSWTKDQVCSLLSAEQRKGGAGLNIEKVKPFYDAG